MKNSLFKALLFISFAFVFFKAKSQTLIMNEVSNGPTGNQEYVEFVVVSNAVSYSCSSPTPPCIDIRGWIFDDNSGYHGTSGVAAGAIRFSQDPMWSCIPLGTIILIYNDADKNPGIPATDDLSMADGNCTIIAPISNTSLFERNITTPGAAACSYPSTGWVAGGNWAFTALANSSDCARIVNLAGCEVFSVCYGATDNLNTLIYFPASGGGTVYSFNGIDPQQQANWTSGSASTMQTPGAPNNAANAAYIAQFNNGCLPITPINVTASSTNAGCSCNGSATASASGSIGGYTYIWYDSSFNPIGQTSATATGLCAGIYKVIAKSSIGCSDTTSVTITSSSTPSLAVNSQTICAGNSVILTATPSVGGGTFLWSPSSQTSSSISVNPSSTTTYSVTYNLAGCSATGNVSVTVIPQPTVTVNSATICSGSSIVLNASGASTYSWSSGANANSITVTPSSNTNYTVTGIASGCSNTVISNVFVTPLPTVTVNSSTICSGTSITLTANGATSYLWSTGATSNTIAVSPSSNSNYTVTGTSSNCTNSVVSNIIVNISPTVTVNSSTICVGSSTTLLASGAATYTWSNGSNNSSILVNPLTTTSYSVLGELSGCLTSATTNVVVSPNLVLSVNAPTICAGQTATLTSAGASSYTWSTGSLSNNIVVSPLVTSSFSVSGVNGLCSGTTVATVIVNPLPTITVNSNTVCSGQTTTLTANGASTYTWSTGLSSNFIVDSPSTNSTYTVIGSTLGCTDTTVAMVSVLPTPTITVNSATICSGQTTTLTASGANSFLWSNGSTSNVINVNPNSSITYSVLGTSGSCSSTATTNVIVNQLPSIAVTSSTICAGQNATLTVNGASSYLWSTGSTSNTLTITPNSTTIYTVVGTSLNCSSSATTNVIVKTVPNISFNANKTFGCAPLCVQFTDLSNVSGSTITNWTWTFNDGYSSNNQNPSHCFDNPGMYNISLLVTASNGCSNTLTNPNMIHVLANPTAEFTSDVFETDILNPIINFTNLSTNANEYVWNFDGVSTSTLTNPSYTYNQEGVYSTTLTATNQLGCKSVAIHDIIVNGIFTFYAPNTFTPNDDNVNDIFLPLGVGWNPEKYQLDIFDRWGNNCFNTKEVGKGWDGRANNGSETAQIDTYTWKVDLTDVFGKNHKYIGRVTIIR